MSKRNKCNFCYH